MLVYQHGGQISATGQCAFDIENAKAKLQFLECFHNPAAGLSQERIKLGLSPVSCLLTVFRVYK